MRTPILLLCIVVTLASMPAMAENMYCVVCREANRPIYSTCTSQVGGEVGRVECGVRNPNCSVTYYDGRYCNSGAPLDKAKLLEHISWSIFHEGCPVYGNTVADWRTCFMRSQEHNPEAMSQIAQASDEDLKEAMASATAVVQTRWQLHNHFQWVCGHEGKGGEFREALAAKDFARIRRVYHDTQNHNPNARNLLAGVSDQFIEAMISDRNICP